MNKKEVNLHSSSKVVQDPITVLIIDEIDRAPKSQIMELLEIAPNAFNKYNDDFNNHSYSSASKKNITGNSKKSQPWECNLIIVGLANTMNFHEQLGITVPAQQFIQQIVFEPYEPDQLKAILRQRTVGLFDKMAVDMLSMKVAASSGRYL